MSILLEESTTQRKTRDAAIAETPAEVQAEAVALLESRDLVHHVLEAIELMGVAGERQLALTIYLVGTSRLLKQPLAGIVQGPSSLGKSYVIDRVADLFPSDEVLRATAITAQALYYMDAGSLKHRFVVSGERERNGKDSTGGATKALREMLSSGGLRKVVTVNDGEGPRSQEYSQEGPIAYIESTTETRLFEEDENRCLILHPDDRVEQTKRILAASARRKSGQGAEVDRTALLARWHAMQWLLEPREVIIPYAEVLSDAFPKEPSEVRRAFEHAGSLIDAIALLHQRQRTIDENGRIVAQAEDYWLARQLIEQVLQRSLSAKPKDSLVRFIQKLHRLDEGDYTPKQIAVALKIGETTVRNHLNSLLSEEVIKLSERQAGPRPAKWRIDRSIRLKEHDAQILPDLFDTCGVNEDELALSELPADWHGADISSVPF